MKRIIYILILISVFAFNLEVKAEWENHNSYKNTMFIDTTYGKIIDYKIVEDKTIWAVTKNNQILSYDLETGKLISHCQCEFDTIPTFKEVSSDGKTTSFAFFDNNYNNENFEIIVVENSNCKSVNYAKMNLFKIVTLDDELDNNWILYEIKDNFKNNRFNLFTKLDYNDTSLYININIETLKFYGSASSGYNINTGCNGYYRVEDNKLIPIYSLRRFNHTNNINTYFFENKNYISHNNYFYALFNGFNPIYNEYNIFSNNLETKVQIRNIYRNNIVNLVNDSTLLLYNYSLDSVNNKPIFRFINYHINTQKFDTLKISRYDFFNQYNSTYQTFKFLSQSTFFIDEQNNLIFEGGIINLNLPDSLIFNNIYGCYNYNKHQNISSMKKYEMKKINGFYTYFYIDNEGILNKLRTIEYGKIFDYGYIISKNIVKINEEIEFSSVLQKQGYTYSWLIEPNVTIETKEPKIKYKYKKVLDGFNVKLTIIDNLGNYVYSTKNSINKIYNCGDYNWNQSFDGKIFIIDSLISNFDIIQDKNYSQTYYIKDKSIGMNKFTSIEIIDEKNNYLEYYLPFKDNVSYKFEKDGVYKILFYVTNGIESQHLERILIVNTNKKINVFNPKLFYLDKDVSKSLKSISIDENGINFIKAKNIVELEKDSLYNLFTNFDRKSISFKGDITDSLNSNILLEQFYLNRLKEIYIQKDISMILINNNIYYTLEYKDGFDDFSLFYNNKEFLKLEKIASFDIKLINQNKFYIEYRENNVLNIKVLEVKNNLLYLTGTYNLDFHISGIFNEFNDDILLLKSYDYQKNLQIFQFEVVKLFNNSITSELYSITLDSSHYNMIANNYFKIIKINEYLFRIIINDKISFLFNTKDASSIFNKPENEELIFNSNIFKSINHKYYYTFDDIPYINCRVNIFNYLENKLVHSIVIPQNRSINYPKQEYMAFNRIRGVSICKNKLFVTLENYKSIKDDPFNYFDFKTYILMDTILFDLSEDITSVENEVVVNSDFLIFPNPSSEKISLDLGGVEVADLVVYDILGNVCISIPNYTNKSEIDISTIPIGTYTIQIQTSTGSISQRLLVNR